MRIAAESTHWAATGKKAAIPNMKTPPTYPCCRLALMALVAIGTAHEARADTVNHATVASSHAGIFHHSGVDLLGYTVERPLSARLYGFYTLGFPSLVAGGYSYYGNFHHHGAVATLGIGIGSVLYASLAYQWRVSGQHYLKLGTGYTAGVAYSGPYPVLSYEHRFD